MNPIRVKVISLGCSKNLVDSERLMHMLKDAGLSLVTEENAPADVAIVNTCGFIGDAKEESINTILELAREKGDGKLSKIYVMGCLSERYRNELPAELPEVDGWYGKFDWPGVVEQMASIKPKQDSYDRHLTTGPHHAYVKIAEGCNRFCAFCAIPIITGRYHSRSIEDIEDEVKHLVSQGVRELNVIAQDLSAYGTDLYGRQAIGELIDRIAAVEGVKWIRLHYAYPAQFPMELLDAMQRNSNVCRYLDIALQHIADPVLANMRRHITSDETRQLLAEIRRRVPGIHIRTTLMVGFPGEGEKEFDELLDFVKEQRFERMGAFAYCEEDDTYAARNFSDDIPQEVKDERLAQLMAVQEEIALESNQAKVGQTLEVVVDSEEDDYYVGRSQYDSPEVDPEVLIKKTRKLKEGEWIDVKITDALPFELIGTPL
ncbi:MAG: 30S ribosomal protein S12 methylthiotransferase RimO [Muribaculaceae bacterium]|nr:30S ribosomal protein S12 methylthiotransferase RimO [Muribaculaceae bacterium]MDE6320761.1 30S ribosomal protein S12 methylthiotransferase RimO [Muribaculaceae bacterium]